MLLGFGYFYVSYEKAENNRLKKKLFGQTFVILFFALLKVGLVGPVDQQINFVLAEVFPLNFICGHFYITIIHKSIFFNWNIISLPYLKMLLINMIKLLFLFFSHWSQFSMLLLVICRGFNSRRFSYSNILIVVSRYSW